MKYKFKTDLLIPVVGLIVFVVVMVWLRAPQGKRDRGPSAMATKEKVADISKPQVAEISSQGLRAVEKAKAEERYLFLCFYRPNSTKSNEMAVRIEEASRRLGHRADFVMIDVADPSEQALIRRHRVRRTPLTLAMAPNGAITAGFTGVVGWEQLEQGFVSPSVSEVIKAIQERKTVFVMFLNSHTEGKEEILAAAREAEETLGDIATAIAVDPEDSENGLFVRNCNVNPNSSQATTVLVGPSGAIAGRLNGVISSSDLYDSFQKVLTMRRGCGARTITGGSACQPGRGITGRSACGAGKRTAQK